MRYLKYILLSLTSLAFVMLSFQGLLVQAQLNDTEDPTTWSQSVSKTSGLQVGEVITLTFDVEIPDGFYMYAAKPVDGVGPYPTEFNLDDESAGVEAVGPLKDVTKPKEKFDDIFGLNIYTFKKKARFSQKVKITKAKPKLIYYLKYQYCTEMACQYGTEEGSIQLSVSGNAAAPNAANTEQTTTEQPNETAAKDTAATAATEIAQNEDANSEAESNKSAKNTTNAEAAETAAAAEQEAPDDGNPKDAWGIFLLALGGGLLAIFTPCVFPLIPMTVTFFTKRTKDRAQGLRYALIYTISIILIFVVPTILLTVLFGNKFLYNLSVHPVTNLILFSILIFFGLSLLGMFELSLPNSWVNKADRQSDKGGVLGIFFMALTLVLASFSCVGPILGLFLTEIAGSNIGIGPVVGMLGFGIGLSIPFGLFATFPSWMQSLPRSGGWLNSVKVVFGFLEIGFALKFLSMADLYWDWELLSRELFLGVWIVIAAMTGFYLLGKLRLPHDTPMEKISVPRVVMSIGFLSFALYLLPGLWGAPMPLLSGILPPPGNNLGVRIAPTFADNYALAASGNQNKVCSIDRSFAEKLSKYAPDGYCMFYDLEEAKTYAKKVNKPLFIDFTGHTCANCREMEHKVWPDREVKEILTQDYVMVSLYVDENTKLEKPIKLPSGDKLRTVGDKWQHFQSENYNLISQPYYVLTDPDLNQLTQRGKGYTRDKQEYIDFLKKGLENFEEQYAKAGR